jgi:hypothetical protein
MPNHDETTTPATDLPRVYVTVPELIIMLGGAFAIGAITSMMVWVWS